MNKIILGTKLTWVILVCALIGMGTIIHTVVDSLYNKDRKVPLHIYVVSKDPQTHQIMINYGKDHIYVNFKNSVAVHMEKNRTIYDTDAK